MLCWSIFHLERTMGMNQRLAAVDLGSNSFRLEIGHVGVQGFERSDYVKETVRLGGGLDGQGQLSDESMQTAWDCLARFGKRLSGFAACEVKAVATQTLREARNSEVFLRKAQALLGFPIEVISGQTEAQLIYRGVAADLGLAQERRLVLDIGGRSTEIIIGQGSQPQWLQSCPLGSVAWSMAHFGDGQLSAQAFIQAQEAALRVLGAHIDTTHLPAWDVAYGAAGTVNAVADVLAQTGWDAHAIGREALEWLYLQLLMAGRVEALSLPGLRPERQPVMAGGLSLLRALMDFFDIPVLTHTSSGLRHGLLQSMVQAEQVTAE